MEIPKEYQQLCKDIAKLLRKFNNENGWNASKGFKESQKTIYSFVGKISSSEPKTSDINFFWEMGRHGDEQGSIKIDTTIRVNTKIDEV